MRSGKRSTAFLKSLIVPLVAISGVIPGTFSAAEAYAGTIENVTDKTITCLGTGSIGNPIAPEGNGEAEGWIGSYVYFGSFDYEENGNKTPMRFRVLSKQLGEDSGFTTKDTAEEGGTQVPSMLLDCDDILKTHKFNNSTTPNENATKANEWAHSDIKTWLNVDFKNGSFTAAEGSAIASSSKSQKGNGDGTGKDYHGFASLTGEQIFLLDAVEVTNKSYGFADTNESSKTRVKKLNDGNAWAWWLRSPNSNIETNAGTVHNFGDVIVASVDNGYGVGVSPAFNVNLESVIFSSLIKSSESSPGEGEPGAEYKLTIADEGMSVAVTNGSKAAKALDAETGAWRVTVPYEITGSHAGNANRVSVLMLDRPYVAGNTNKAEVKFYGALTGNYNEDGSLKTTGEGSFTLPENYYPSWKTYIVAEEMHTDNSDTADIDESLYTDYAAVSEVYIPSEESFKWYADSAGSRTICLGTEGIMNPVMDTLDNDNPGGWSYVYYGSYGTGESKTPMRYRVLSRRLGEDSGFTTKDTAEESGKTVPAMLLDCDDILENQQFDKDGSPNEEGHEANEWAISDIRTWLNGDFKSGSFTAEEASAIASSSKSQKGNGDGTGKDYHGFASLTGEQIFLLDAVEATNTSYGFEDTGNSSSTRVKKRNGINGWWWLRSPKLNSGTYAGNVNIIGEVSYDSAIHSLCVSPTFNVNLESVIFSILISSGEATPGERGTAYKLVLKDPAMTVTTDGKNVTRSGKIVTIPYTVAGDNAGNATRLSVLVTDKAYSDSGAKILQYGILNTGGTVGSSGTGTFVLADGIGGTWGTGCHVYILAENVNGEKETDYASEPVEIHIHTLKHYDGKEPSDTSEGNIEYWECSECGELFSDEAGTHKISREDTVIPKLKKISATATGFSGSYDGKAHGIIVKVTDPSSGAAVRYGTVAGTYDKTTSPEYTEVGTYAVYYEVMAEGYKALIGQAIVEIKEADAPGPEHTHTVTVENGSGDGNYAAGDMVTIKADAPADGMVFDRWTGDGVTFADAASETTTFKMPAKPVTIKATYRDKNTVAAPVFSPDGGNYTSEQNVTISCSTEGAEIYYSVDGSDSTKASAKYSEPIPVKEDMTIKAIAVKDGMTDSAVSVAAYTIGSETPVVTKYKVTVNNGTGDGKYEENETVTIKADEPAEEKVFDKWTTEDGVAFADAASPETTFTMPAHAVTVTAAYKDKEADKPDPDDPGKEDDPGKKGDPGKEDNPGQDDPKPVNPDPANPDSGKTPEQVPDKVPVTDPTSSYASPEDNFAPVAPGSSEGTGGNIKKLELDFSNVKASGVDPGSLKMTAITGSKFTTKAKVKDKNSVHTDGGVKAKFNKKDSTVTITCKNTGKATFDMEDGDSYTVAFTVEKPKPNKSEGKLMAGSAPVTKTVKDLFGTSITGGKLEVIKEKVSGQVTPSGNGITINPAEKNTIKIQYQYLNKKYKMSIKVK